MKVKEIMTPHVKTIDENSTASEAADIMGSNNIGSLVVTSYSGPVGILTERDVLNSVSKIVSSSGKIKISQIMSKLITVSPENEVGTALRVMAERGIKKLPVIQNGSVVGIVTDTDIIKSMKGLDELLSMLLDETERLMGKQSAANVFRKAYETISPEERSSIKHLLPPKLLESIGVIA